MLTADKGAAEAPGATFDGGHTEALLKAGALQRAIFNSANFSSIATDAKGVIQIFNVGAERMLGYTAAEVMNQITPADISDPQEVIVRATALSLEFATPIAPGFEALVFKASRGIEDIYELTYFRKDGSRFPAVVSVTALRDAQDAIIGYLLIGTDNTARKHAEEALLKAGALQRAIFNSANFSSIATDAKGVIQIFNVGAERMLGYTAAEVMNKITPADISDPQEVITRAKVLSAELGTPITPGFEALVFKASRGIEDIYELTYIRQDGSRFPAVVSVTALRDAHGAIIGYLLIGTDNTARKEIEEERKKLEQTLKQSNVALENASLAKDRFLASMSHELRTPLNAVIGFTGTLLMRLPGPLTDDQESQLRTVQTSARQLLSLINDLLDLAKIESGKVELHFESVSCQSVIDEVSSALSPLAVAKGLTFEVIPAAEDCVVQTDRRALSQILINLTNNAIKFTERGHVSLNVAQCYVDARARTEIYIRDTGPGIPPGDQARLFQAFKQIENTTSRRHEGTGLGLYLSQKLAALLGGEITCDSEPGRGTTFTVVLPEAP
jgi:PAS domain S-box-containing protein